MLALKNAFFEQCSKIEFDTKGTLVTALEINDQYLFKIHKVLVFFSISTENKNFERLDTEVLSWALVHFKPCSIRIFAKIEFQDTIMKIEWNS